MSAEILESATLGTFNYTVNDTRAFDHEESQFSFILNKIVTPVLFGMISLLGLIGNSLVIYVIVSRHKMRTVTNLLLLNLAFADLSFVLVIPPCTAYQYSARMFPFGNAACKLMHYLVNVTAYVTVYTLVLISVIRYMTVVHNHSTMRIRSKCNVILMIIAIWVVMLIVNSSVMFSYGVTLIDGNPECDLYNKADGQKIFGTFFAFAYVLPLFVIGVFSILILRHITTQRPAMISKRSKSHDKKKQAGRLLILVVVIFAVLWLPVHIHLLLAFFGNPPETPWYGAMVVLFNCLAYFNSCVNPMIYNRASKEFRDAFREVVCYLKEGQEVNGYSNAPPGKDATAVSMMSPINENGKDAAGKRLLADHAENNTTEEARL